MKNRIIVIMASLAMVFGLSSCLPDGPIKSNYSDMATWKGGVLYTDEGLEFIIKESKASTIPQSEDRIFILCDVLKQPSENVYEIKLLEWYPVKIKDFVKLSAEGTDKYKNEEGLICSDPISLGNAWFSKGNLNMYLNYVVKDKSETVHDFDILIDDTKPVQDTLYMQLVHNAHGEYYGNSEYKDNELMINRDYASYSTDGLIPDGKDKIIIKLSWKWHKIENNFIVKDTQDYSINGVVTRD